MRIRYDFSVDAWIKGVEVDGVDSGDCQDQLYNMTLSELIDEGYVKDFTIKDISETIVEETLTVDVYDIEYDISDEDIDDSLYSMDSIVTKEDLINSLPKKLTLEIDVEEGDDLDDKISDEISDKTGWTIKNYKYNIIK